MAPESKTVLVRSSAPAKLILSGEHVVVYGAPAIATALDMRTSVTISQPTSSSKFTVTFNCFYLTFNITSTDLIQHFWSSESRNFDVSKPGFNSALYSEILKYLEDSFESTCHSSNPECLSKFKVKALNSLSIIIYLSRALLQEPSVLYSSELDVSTEASVSAGLGSSASFAVSVVAALMRLRDLQHGKHEKILTDERKQLINKWAFIVESIVHGNPSGVDNAICTFGGILKFQGGSTQQIESRSDKATIRVVVIDSNIDRSTRQIINELKQRYDTHPTLFRSIFNAIEETTKECLSTISSPTVLDLNMLGRLLTINHRLLSAIGVSNSRIEYIVNRLMESGLAISGGKLTGAGCGGCVFAIIEEDDTVDLQLFEGKVVELFHKDDKVDCCKIWISKICGEGVRYDD